MAVEFTQEQQELFNSTLADKKAQWARKYEGYASPDDVAGIKADYEKQIADLTAALDGANKKQAAHDKEIAERDSKIKAYETASVKTKIAHESGLAYEAIEFLRGETEDEIRSSADALKRLTGARHVPEFKQSSGDQGSAASLRKLAQNLGNK